MEKATLTQARKAHETTGCNLENTICEFLEQFGEEGFDLKTNTVPATEVAGNDTLKLSKVRFFDDTLEGCEGDGEWVSLSAFNRPADYAVYAGYLAAMLEITE